MSYLEVALVFGLLAQPRLEPLMAQDYPTVKANLSSRALETNPPFDQAFTLTVDPPDDVSAVTVDYGPAIESSAGAQFIGNPGTLGTVGSHVTQVKSMSFRVPPLKPNQLYLFRFKFTPGTGAGSPKYPAGWYADVNVLVRAQADLRRHFDSDFGVIHAPDPGPGYVGAGSNVHFYFVPVNKAESLNNRAMSLHDQVLKRVSLFAGLSFIKLRQRTAVDHMLDIGSPVWGVGLRPRFGDPLRRLDFFRVNAGIIYFTQKDRNPLVTDKRGKRAAFYSITGDVDLTQVLAPITLLVGAARK